MINYEPGSFRDPNGRVFKRYGRIFRTITNLGEKNFLSVLETGLLDDLVAKGKVVPWKEVSSEDVLGKMPKNICRVIEHEKIDFISYPYEWSFTHLKSAARK